MNIKTEKYLLARYARTFSKSDHFLMIFSHFDFRMIASTTRFLALIGTCVSLHALLSLLYVLKPIDWFLAMPWFLLNLVAQILCWLVFHHYGNKLVNKRCFLLMPFLCFLCFVRLTNWPSRRCQLAGKCSWVALLNYFFLD